jgi:uncharacterized protein YkwD
MRSTASSQIPSAVVAILVLACPGCGPRAGAVAPGPSIPAGEGEPAKEGGRSPQAAAPPPAMLAVLEAHNRVRAEHCAPPLAWSAELASVAQAWADQLRDQGCAFGHSRSRYGENLYFAAPSDQVSGARAVESWASERAAYSFARPGFSMQTGHFTQVVWRATRELGCGTAQCNGGDLWVCNYAPAGNVRTLYEANVQPTSCRP